MQITYKNANLGDRTVKNAILSFLHKNIPQFALTKETILTSESLEHIKQTEYIICPRLKGVKTWIVLFNDENNYYAVNFQKIHSKIRRYEKQTKLVIHKLDIEFSKQLYDGTIMEGVFRKTDECTSIVIDEIYLYAGQTTLTKNKIDRLSMVSDILQNNVRQTSTFKLCTATSYDITKESIMNLYSKNNDDVQEIIFYPLNRMDTIFKYIVTLNDFKEDILEQSVFVMEKTKNIDVYNLYTISTNTKIGIALIPTASKTKECKSWFKKTKQLKVLCIKDQPTGKWVPHKIHCSN